MAILHLCLDESGKFRDSDYVSFCGYVSYAHDWEAFSQDWMSALLSEGLSVLHTTDAYRFNGDEWKAKKAAWGTDAEAERDALLLRFAAIVNKHAGPCVGAAVDAAHYRKMASDFRKRLTNPHYLGFEQVVREVVGLSNVAGQQHTIGLIVDDEEEYSIECYRLLTKLKLRNPDMRNRLTSLCFANDNTYPPLQAADLLAHVTRHELIRKSVEPGRTPGALYSALTINHRGSQPLFFDAKSLDGIAEDLKKQKR
jgi:hypothetical protein